MSTQRAWWTTTTLLLAAWLPNGCSREEPALPLEQVATEIRPIEPLLPTAGDPELTLFGELPERARVPFHARAASPMEQHTFTTEGADFDVDISPDGKWMVFASTRHSVRPDIYLKTINGRAVTQLCSDPASDVEPCFSPDGKSVVFASNRSGNWDLWLIGLDGGRPRQLTNSPMHEIHPSFAPEGKRLAYCAFNARADQWELWTVQLDLPSSNRMIGIGLFPEWSPIGDSIIYQRARERGGRWFSIWRTDLEMGEPRYPTEVAASPDMALIQPGWSPDGQWIAYGTAKPGTGGETPDATGPILSRGDIWVIRADGTSPLQLTDGEGTHFSPTWGVDQRVYFSSRQTGAENLWSVRPALAPIMPSAAAAEEGTNQGLSGKAVTERTRRQAARVDQN
ncbi:MAG TPA: DPP IV N-terminal domain-containing protein [Phycisphaerae bacterium]|nr:DPP IV N-terminal domain-containing protein [Phycisphaerae bacterium]HRY68483.1 DPP IV N-terminal domain-containing protein [Phycisphaerae bacterium]HSA29522.1 DPP IV N-terminal domain-containing protein [Phycisphaerae bacterium]